MFLPLRGSGDGQEPCWATHTTPLRGLDLEAPRKGMCPSGSNKSPRPLCTLRADSPLHQTMSSEPQAAALGVLVDIQGKG